jgi:hypothetical protein
VEIEKNVSGAIMKKVMVVCAVLVMCFPILFTNTSKAYVLNGWKKQPHPTGLLYNITNTVSDTGLSNYVIEGTTAWNNAKELSVAGTVSQPGYADFYFTYSDVTTDDYAVTYGSSDSSHDRIVLWKSFKGLSSTRKKETVCHEVGHALGLAHTQSSNNSKAVMRALDFNDKPYPLSDDLAGIAKLY